MKKQNFISELISYGTGFALTFLVVLGTALAMVVLLAIVAAAAFFNRLMN